MTIWKPYTRMYNLPHQLKVLSAFGSILTTESHGDVIDSIASWWTACHGYSHEYILDAMQSQMSKLSHVMFAGITHEPAEELTSRLLALLPYMKSIFYCDSGSVSVEIALKMCLQYFYLHNKPLKNKFLAFYDGYHGDTIATMALEESDKPMHKVFESYLRKEIFSPIPKDKESKKQFIFLLDTYANSIAGIILEPRIQAAGGMKFHDIDTCHFIIQEAHKRNILVIFDEIATGFYRTGSLFAHQSISGNHDIYPDIICIGKAFSAGMLSFAATLANNKIYDIFNDTQSFFMHGPTYMGNPLAAQAALSSLELFEHESYNINNIAKIFISYQKDFYLYEDVISVRAIGGVGVIEMRNVLDSDKITKIGLEEGIWIRPLKNVIYIMPSLNISVEDLHSICQAILKILKKLDSKE